MSFRRTLTSASLMRHLRLRLAWLRLRLRLRPRLRLRLRLRLHLRSHHLRNHEYCEY